MDSKYGTLWNDSYWIKGFELRIKNDQSNLNLQNSKDSFHEDNQINTSRDHLNNSIFPIFGTDFGTGLSTGTGIYRQR